MNNKFQVKAKSSHSNEPPQVTEANPYPQTVELVPDQAAPNALRKIITSPAKASPATILQLQRTYGNQAVLQLLGKFSKQVKAPPPKSKAMPTMATTSNSPGVIQRFIEGLEKYAKSENIPDNWVDLYLTDIKDDSAHLFEIDIVSYLDQKDTTWKDKTKLINTGGNHWDVLINNKTKVETVGDGDCGIHAIDVILNRDSFTEPPEEPHTASADTIKEVREIVHASLSLDRKEVKDRIVLEINRCASIDLTGFGRNLMEELRKNNTQTDKKDIPVLPLNEIVIEKEKAVSGNPVSTAQPSPPEFNKETKELIEKILKLEKTLIHMVDVEAIEKNRLEKLQKKLEGELKPKIEELKKAKEEKKSEQEVSQLTEAVRNLKTELRQQYEEQEKIANERRENAPKLLKSVLPKQFKEWQVLMEQLCGSHVGSVSKPHIYPQLLTQRHDAKPGIYGKTPTEEDQKIGSRRMEILHGHGAWTRSGLLSRGSAKARMPGLVSLGEIIEKANVIREKSGRKQIEPGKVDLAFVSYHGIPTTSGRGYPTQPQLETGAYPNLFDLPKEMVEEVKVLLEKCKEKDPSKVDDWFKRQCEKPDPTQKKPKTPNKSFNQRYVWKDKHHQNLYAAFKRIQQDKVVGEAAKYVEILRGNEEANVLFPDMRLSSLTPLTANKDEPATISHRYDQDIKNFPLPNVNTSLYEDFAEKKFDDGDNKDNEGTFQLVTSVKLSDAIATRLAEIDKVEEPIRFFWAACRSEMLPTGFDLTKFEKWIKEAAEVRRNENSE